MLMARSFVAEESTPRSIPVKPYKPFQLGLFMDYLEEKWLPNSIDRERILPRYPLFHSWACLYFG